MWTFQNVQHEPPNHAFTQYKKFQYIAFLMNFYFIPLQYQSKFDGIINLASTL
jgi:hypothetical protein